MKAGFIQTYPEFGEVQSNLKRASALMEKKSAELWVLPELFSTGYQFHNIDEARNLAESIPDGPVCRALIDWAGLHKTHIIAGLAEIDGESIYNSAVFIGPDGYIGTYRKAHIFDSERAVFEAGELPLKVYDIGTARVGIMICFDWRFPETARSLALQGADIIAHPSNLVLPHCPQAMITRCLENRVYAITADRVGVEDRDLDNPLKFIGQSQIVDPDGNILYRASEDSEEVCVVEIDIEKARNKKINCENDLFSDRRVDLYKLQ